MNFSSTAAGRDDLAVRVARALAAGERRTALELADRLCRLRAYDDPSHLTLLALAAARSGLPAIATNRLERALESDPNFLFAARAGMAILRGDAREAAARTVLRFDESDANLLKAAAILCTDDRPVTIVGSEGGSFRIRVAMRSADRRAEPVTELDGTALPIRRRLADAGLRIDEWRFERPPGPARARVDPRPGEVESTGPTFVVALDPAHGFAPLPRPDDGAAPVLNVVVPIYDDFDATAACLESLEGQACEGFSTHIVLVDDDSPSPRIRALVASYAGRVGCTVVSNDENLGFTGAVNKGLAYCLDGDVLLLNADTVLPRDALDRLVRTAHAHPDAGTLTPFSNNGQYVSFPRPFESNLLPGEDDLERLSEAAWLANGTAVCPVPSGIGFCLFVRRDCMAACHRLGEQFDKGYYEDVDLCLRAENLGWRNVCATGVYVGHEGSRSFRDDKSILAARNRTVLDRTYPLFGKRAAAWLAADPLFAFRGRIEDRLAPPAALATLLLACDDASRSRAERMAANAADAGGRILLAELGEREGNAALLVRAASGAPQGAAFFMRQGRAAGRVDFLQRHGVVHIVVLDPAAVEPWLLDELAGVASVEIAEGDAGLFCPRRSLLRADGRHCAIPDDPAICDACIATGGSASAFALDEGVAAWRRRSAALAFGVPDVPHASYVERFARSAAGEYGGSETRSIRGDARSAPAVARAKSAPRLALLPIFTAALETRLLHDLCSQLSLRGVDTVVTGATLSDDFLLALPKIFVAGPVRESELDEIVRIYGITHAMIASRRFAPGHLLSRAARRLDLPLAQFEFRFAAPPAAPGDLLLDVGAEPDTVAQRLAEWVEAGEGQAPAAPFASHR